MVMVMVRDGVRIRLRVRLRVRVRPAGFHGEWDGCITEAAI